MRSALPLLALLCLAGAAHGGRVPVQVVAISGPAELGPLPVEVGRALSAALSPLRPEGRPGESEARVTGRLEAEAQGRLRLSATCRGQTVEARGDLEHLDELVAALSQRLRPILEAPPEPPPAASTPTPPAPQKTPPPQVSKAPQRPPAKPAPTPPVKVAQTDKPRPEPPAPPPPKPEPLPPPDLAPAEAPQKSEPRPEPRPEARPDEEARVAVSIMGEPVGQMPPGLYGIGMAAQGLLVQGLHRQRVKAQAARIMGLVGGRDALAASLRVGARYTIMGRFEQLLVAGTGEPGALTLAGRLHLVLLFDGRLRLDRSYPLPPTSYSQGEPASSVAGRALSPLLDLIASDISGKL